MTSSRTDLPADVEFEPEFLAALREIYEEKILFNQWMGLRVDSIKATGIVASLAMKPELVGHFAYHRIHGGVISAVLDAMGSLAVMAAWGAKHMDEPPATRCARALASASSFMPMPCEWVPKLATHAWSFLAPMANCCLQVRRPT